MRSVRELLTWVALGILIVFALLSTFMGLQFRAWPAEDVILEATMYDEHFVPRLVQKSLLSYIRHSDRFFEKRTSDGHPLIGYAITGYVGGAHDGDAGRQENADEVVRLLLQLGHSVDNPDHWAHGMSALEIAQKYQERYPDTDRSRIIALIRETGIEPQ